MYKTFNTDNAEKMESNMFFGPTVAVARYDRQKYPAIEKLVERQNGYFWLPQEVDITKDTKDFKELTSSEKHIFISNLKRQILLDSIQGRSPVAVLLPICSLPELENWLIVWSYFETIHSRSYTHIIRNIFPNPSLIFDDILEIPEIVSCANDISKYYDDLFILNAETDPKKFGNRAHKEALWRALISVNALEGIRFYVSFACSWAFVEQKKLMEGNAKIIKLIARDENLHLASTQHILKNLVLEDDDFAEIARDCDADGTTESIFRMAAEQEKAWADYLFKDGSMVGLNAQMLKDYVEWLTNKRFKSVCNSIGSTGTKTIFPEAMPKNPLPWTERWISGQDVQVAAQEAALSSYTTGGILVDDIQSKFSSMTL